MGKRCGSDAVKGRNVIGNKGIDPIAFCGFAPEDQKSFFRIKLIKMGADGLGSLIFCKKIASYNGELLLVTGIVCIKSRGLLENMIGLFGFFALMISSTSGEEKYNGCFAI